MILFCVLVYTELLYLLGWNEKQNLAEISSKQDPLGATIQILTSQEKIWGLIYIYDAQYQRIYIKLKWLQYEWIVHITCQHTLSHQFNEKIILV